MTQTPINLSFSPREVTLIIFALRYLAGDIEGGTLPELADDRPVLERVADSLEIVRDWE